MLVGRSVRIVSSEDDRMVYRDSLVHLYDRFRGELVGGRRVSDRPG